MMSLSPILSVQLNYSTDGISALPVQHNVVASDVAPFLLDPTCILKDISTLVTQQANTIAVKEEEAFIAEAVAGEYTVMAETAANKVQRTENSVSESAKNAARVEQAAVFSLTILKGEAAQAKVKDKTAKARLVKKRRAANEAAIKFKDLSSLLQLSFSQVEAGICAHYWELAEQTRDHEIIAIAEEMAADVAKKLVLSKLRSARIDVKRAKDDVKHITQIVAKVVQEAEVARKNASQAQLIATQAKAAAEEAKRDLETIMMYYNKVMDVVAQATVKK